MKSTLTIEQSATLISKGVSPQRANAVDDIRTVIDGVPTFSPGTKPIFTLGDLFSLLPTTTGGYYRLEMSHDGDNWRVAYNLWDYYPDVPELDDSEGNSCATELIDALYETLLWAIDNNHVKLD